MVSAFVVVVVVVGCGVVVVVTSLLESSKIAVMDANLLGRVCSKA